jgi:hypothetical protein
MSWIVISQAIKRAHPTKCVELPRDLVVLPPRMNNSSQVRVNAAPDQDFRFRRQLNAITGRDLGTHIPSQLVTRGQG